MWTATVMLAASMVLAGCVSTTDLEDDATTRPPPAMPSPTVSVPSPPATVDGDYAVPGVADDELSRITFVAEGADGVSEGEATVSGVVKAGERYVIDFDCSPSTARVTLEWTPAPAEGEEPANPVGPTSVTQDCGAPGRIEGIAYDADTLVQLKMFADELNAGWAVLRPGG
ncbi:hypothetical protein [Microbacterium aquilitoris]|uniref:hypothetical protein n=1 Tax=Microbacterium aquilitoris TaxID=3067307 RepID=UPI00288DEB62|nr:hypothetical protein [Microbacterium sp. KSW2-22]MDT3346073.1 hypothetical protein [Microbacterium sp. KSW2-22]